MDLPVCFPAVFDHLDTQPEQMPEEVVQLCFLLRFMRAQRYAYVLNIYNGHTISAECSS